MAEQLRTFLRLKQVKSITGMSRSWIYDAVRRGAFPAPIALSRRAIAWDSVAIRECLCFELVVLYYRIALGDFPDQAERDRVYESRVTADWLGDALSRLKAEAIDASPSVRRQATRYGWTDADE